LEFIFNSDEWSLIVFDSVRENFLTRTFK
jgi:hypothetical protein